MFFKQIFSSLFPRGKKSRGKSLPFKLQQKEGEKKKQETKKTGNTNDAQCVHAHWYWWRRVSGHFLVTQQAGSAAVSAGSRSARTALPPGVCPHGGLLHFLPVLVTTSPSVPLSEALPRLPRCDFILLLHYTNFLSLFTALCIFLTISHCPEVNIFCVLVSCLSL